MKEQLIDQETLELLSRVRLGNDKLFHAWEQIREYKGPIWNEQMDKFTASAKKLRELCSKLKLMGYIDCLYKTAEGRTRNCLHNPDGFWCQVCPSDIRYWETEIMEG